MILSVDSSAVTASVALTDGKKVIKSEFINAGLTHSETLLPMIKRVMGDYKITDLDAIAVTAGPGSFTGVRIGVATVKGLAFNDNISCISVSTLEAIACNFLDEDCIVCSVMDARRMQFYNALFEIKNGKAVRLCDDRAISIDDLKNDLKKYEKVIIAGDGEERQMLEELARETCPEGSVIFAGWVKDTDSFYNAIDVNMLTSLSEGSPYALVEGARMRCATIATSVGGIPYMMESGVTGLLFTPRDVDTLTAYMVRLVQNPAFRKQLGQNFYEKAERVYSAEATVNHQLDIYRAILRQAAQPKEKRRGVTICGAYGKGNAGDEAILKAILRQLQHIDPDMPICVLSHNPKSTRLTHHVGAAYVFNPFSFLRVMRRSKLYISGGGSLIQDQTIPVTATVLYSAGKVREGCGASIMFLSFTQYVPIIRMKVSKFYR